MNRIIALSALLVCLCRLKTNAVQYSGPSVYVVTPSPRTLQIDEGRSAPYYHHKWIRRMDSPRNTTTTITTTTPKINTPDLIFAEFESDSIKNIRKLLEKERIQSKTSTTSQPIYVPEEDTSQESQDINNGVTPPITDEKEETHEEDKDMTDYFAVYNNLYGNGDHLPAPVYLPATLAPTTETLKTSTTTITTTTNPPISNLQNIWHIIDSEKHHQYSGKWDEVPISSESDQKAKPQDEDNNKPSSDKDEKDDEEFKIDEDFALPGFGTNPGNGAENESRAIRTEPNTRFPYVNLKPFQLKNVKKPLINSFYNSKKGNNMYTSLDNFFEIKNPVRGEAQDVVAMRQPVERYNPAQPYLPALSNYGSKSKQSSPSSTPMKAVANLVPPPPPPAPKVTADDFPAPISYESFPPYAPSVPDSAPPAPRPVSMPQPPSDSDDSDSQGPGGSDGPPMDTDYQYQQPEPPSSFLPTLPPLNNKPYGGGYSYDKPTMTADAPPPMTMDNKPDFHGYSYDKPVPAMPSKPDYHGYHYSKPESPPPPPKDDPPISYGHNGPPSYGHGMDSDYPELIYSKPHGGIGDTKGGDDMKGDDMGMAPPPAPDMMKPDMGSDMASGSPMDDHGFPHDFPGDFKYHHDFDDHDFYHHHHHHTTTTTSTTTTEMPRVNRYSYYYLGKKLYYLPLYFSVYFIIYVGALIIKAVLRHKIVYPNSWRPNDQTASFFTKRSVDSWDLSNENLHEMTGKVTHAIATAAEKYMNNKETKNE